MLDNDWRRSPTSRGQVQQKKQRSSSRAALDARSSTGRSASLSIPSLTRDRESTRSSRHRPLRGGTNRRGARASRTAPRLFGWRRLPRDQPHGPHQDDGRGSAVLSGAISPRRQPVPARSRSMTSSTAYTQAWRPVVQCAARSYPRRAQAGAGSTAQHRRRPVGPISPAPASASEEFLERPSAESPIRAAKLGPRRLERCRANEASVDHSTKLLARCAEGHNHGRHVRGRHQSVRIFQSPTSARRAEPSAAVNTVPTPALLDRAAVRRCRARRFVSKSPTKCRSEPRGDHPEPGDPFAKSCPAYMMPHLSRVAFLDAYAESSGILTPP